MTTKTIALADIHLPDDRLRPVKDDHASAQALSIGRDRPMPAIVVRSTPNGARKWTLVAGAHRLRAAELAGKAEIEAVVVKADADTAREIEIEENLFRNDLTALEKIYAVAEYRRIFDLKFGQTLDEENEAVSVAKRVCQNGAATVSTDDLNLLGFVEGSETANYYGRVADKMGVSRRMAQRFSTIARTLQPRLKAALQRSAAEDHLSLIERFSRQTPEDQMKLAMAMETETDFNAVAAEALVFARPQLSMAAKRMATVTSNFSALGKRERRRLLREMVARWRDDFEWALNADEWATDDADEANAEGGDS